MKRTFFLLLTILLVLVSCSTVNKQDTTSVLANMGKEGDIIITGISDFLVPEYANKISRLSFVYNKGTINGCIEGSFSKLQGNIASKYIDLYSYNLDYYQPKRGLFILSSSDAKEYAKELVNKSNIIDEIDYSRMLDADLAIFSKNPNIGIENLDKMLIVVKDGLCNAEFKASSLEKSKGLSIYIKSQYVSYLTKNSIPVNYTELNECFKLNDNTVYIQNISYDGFIQCFVGELLNYGR